MTDNFLWLSKEQFIQRLLEAGWALKDAEAEWKQIQNDDESGL